MRQYNNETMKQYNNRIMKSFNKLVFWCSIIVLIGCKSSPKTLPIHFDLISEKQSNITFSNTITETATLNYFTYQYLYNGGGVVIADINNDGLEDIFFSGNVVADQLYLNKGNLQFEEITEQAGILKHGFSTGVTIADMNEDGFLDIYVCRSMTKNPENRKNVLYINNRTSPPTFTEKATEYGLADESFSSHANFFDYDKDGDLDLFLVNHSVDFQHALTIKTRTDAVTNQVTEIENTTTEYNTDRLYRNDGNQQFTDVTIEANLVNDAFSLSATVSDINKDGWLDIYVANDFLEPDHLYINQKDGTFKDEIHTALGHISQNSMGCDIADYNNDGWSDIIVTDMLAEEPTRQKKLRGPQLFDRYNMAVSFGKHHQVMRNTLQLNQGISTRTNQLAFSEIGSFAGIEATDWSWSTLFADFDNDGDKDLYITNGIRRDITDMDYIHYDSPVYVRKVGGKEKVNSLELLDLMPQTKVPNYYYENNLGDAKNHLKFTNQSHEMPPSFSNGAAYGDLDNDGDLDLVVNNINEIAFLFENKTNQKEQTNYLKIKLKGANKNTFGFGAKVTLYYQGQIQYQEQSPNRGYYSSVSPVLFFGLKDVEKVDAIKIEWLSGRLDVLKNVQTNQTLTIEEKNATLQQKNGIPLNIPIFSTVEPPKGLNYHHRENDFVDFKREPLLPYTFSDNGAAFAISDVNQDGLEDIFIGGALGFSGSLFLQELDGSFEKHQAALWEKDKNHEDSDVLFIDIDQDQDLDLIVTSGGNEYPKGSEWYQDRLYLNDGKGNFQKSKHRLPPIFESTACIVAKDYDLDGDVDIFFGSGIVPNQYPLSPTSYLLKNQDNRFVSVPLPNDGLLGMITDAKWINTRQNIHPQLVVVGMWKPIRILSFEETVPKITTIPNSNGWWNCLMVDDIDQDGDQDLLVGNRGTNAPYDNLTVFAADFDKNQQIDPIETYHYKNSQNLPKSTLDQIALQLPHIRKQGIYYKDYAAATYNDLFTEEERKNALRLTTNTFSSMLFKNEGNLNFTSTPLPATANFSPIQDFLVKDFNKDGYKDILAIGNKYGAETEIGRFDASYGSYLKGGENGFLDVPTRKSGFWAHGDARKIGEIEVKGKRFLVVSCSRGKLLFFGVGG